MDTVYIKWQDRLEAYYNIAAAGGSNDPEAVGGEWFDWARREYGRYTNLELESIPDKAYKKFVKYCEEPY